jgi:hypothetical protein
MSKTVTRVPTQSVLVIRDGQRVYPEIGKPFEFTADEVKQLERGAPEALSTLAMVDVTEEKKSEDI